AVLPFDNMSGDPAMGYFGDGVSEDIISMLSRSPDVMVVARNSSFTYKGKATDARQIGKDLNVGYVLEGSVRKRPCWPRRLSWIPPSRRPSGAKSRFTATCLLSTVRWRASPRLGYRKSS